MFPKFDNNILEGIYMNLRLSFSIFAFLFLFTQAFAQVPNSGFEQWTNGEPDGWYVNNIPEINIITVTQSSDVHSGASALKGEAINSSGAIFPPLVIAGKLNKHGFPISQNYVTLSGFYKFSSSVPGDYMVVTVALYSKTNGIAGWYQKLYAATSYTNFNLPIIYTNQEATADSCLITITMGNDTSGIPHAGSVFYIDDISLSDNATSVKEPANAITSFKLEQNFPNPFNPSTIINWQSPIAGWQSLKVYDILGNEVATLVNEYRAAGNYQAEFNPGNLQLSSGIYLYKLQVGNFIQTKKMTYIK